MTIALMIDLRADTGKTTITAELRKHETMIGQMAGRSSLAAAPLWPIR